MCRALSELNLNRKKKSLFAQEQLRPEVKKGVKPTIVLLDNVGFHKSEKIIKLIEGVGASVDFIPSYSPEFNPIEMIWSFIKNIIRQAELRTIAQFQYAIKNAFFSVTQAKLTAWFEHVGYRSTL
jgi:transposase